MSFFIRNSYISGASARSVNIGAVEKGDLVVVQCSINGAGSNDPGVAGFTKIGGRVGNGNYLYYKWITSDDSGYIINYSFPTGNELFYSRIYVFRGLTSIKFAWEQSPSSYTYSLGNTCDGVIISTNSSHTGVYNEFFSQDTVESIGVPWTWTNIVPTIVAIKNPNTRFLIQSGEVIKKFSGSWKDVGVAPVTQSLFRLEGMTTINEITDEQWKEIPRDSKILAYTEDNKVFTADVSMHNLYDPVDKSYHGTGIIETEIEELPETRKFLIINAEHKGCTFKYSLNNGATWTDINPGDMKDISKESGVQLKIQVELPTDDATLTAISYAWA